MTFHVVRKALVLILIALPLACGGAGIANMKKGTKVTVSGEIDNIIHTELPYEKEMLSVTAVGFTSGQSIALIGLHPGLNKETDQAGEFSRIFAGPTRSARSRSAPKRPQSRPPRKPCFLRTHLLPQARGGAANSVAGS
jgi:hypothetical protein